MSTNITQKDEAFKQVIDYCEKKMNNIGNELDIIADHLPVSDTVYGQLLGQVDAYKDIALKCRHLCRKTIDNGD